MLNGAIIRLRLVKPVSLVDYSTCQPIKRTELVPNYYKGYSYFILVSLCRVRIGSFATDVDTITVKSGIDKSGIDNFHIKETECLYNFKDREREETRYNDVNDVRER